jgi:hypothetical protein
VGQLLTRTVAAARRVTALLAALGVATSAVAADWELDLDSRLLTVNGPPPFIAGGPGSLRFGGDESGLRLGRARFAVSQALGEIVSLHIDASSWGDHDKIPAGLTEAYRSCAPTREGASGSG